MPENNLPLYEQIALEMRENIKKSIWKEGEKIPTEKELGEMYHVSRITIRGALDELVRENLLYRKRPVGTFVSDKSSQQKDIYTVFKNFDKEMEELGLEASTKKANVVKSFADPDISSYLNINIGEPIILLKRVRGDSKRTFAYFRTYFKYEESFSLRNSDYYDSFYDYLKTFNIQVSTDKEIVEVILPNREVATALSISKSTPALKRTRFTSDQSTNFYEFTECFYIGSDYRYYLNFS